MIVQIENKQELDRLVNDQDVVLLMFYTPASETSLQAKSRVVEASAGFEEVPVALVDASAVRTLHSAYGVNSVPTVLVLKNAKPVKTVQGLQSQQHYELLFYDSPQAFGSESDERQHHVVVYSTPTCSWCTRLKQHLRQNRVRFQDVDVSRDQQAAQQLMERTGQTGVPQTEIDGQWIVGFDQQRIDNLLGLTR
ncbi:MAG: thioredoxin family protein [candidate division KSB1 bacterium]|nr:thioredoxin family protein [candidate division KSB1 bacterium]